MYNVGIVSHFCFSTQLQVSLQPLYMLHISYRFNVFTCSDLDLILRSYSVFIKLSNLRFFSQTKKGNTIYTGQCIIYKQIMYKHQGITHIQSMITTDIKHVGQDLSLLHFIRNHASLLVIHCIMEHLLQPLIILPPQWKCYKVIFEIHVNIVPPKHNEKKHIEIHSF